MKKILYIDKDYFFQKIVAEKIQKLFRGSDVLLVDNFVDAYEKHETENLALIICNLKDSSEFIRAIIDQGTKVPMFVNITGDPFPSDSFLDVTISQIFGGL